MNNVHKYHPFPGQALEWCHIEATSYKDERERHFTKDLDNATCLTSVMTGGDDWTHLLGTTVGDHGQVMHRPVLDLDLAAHVIPSTAPGHCHLLIDKPMGWETYSKLLDALAEAGIIEDGYARASQRREHTSIRLPWIRKGVDQGGHDCAPHTCEWAAHTGARDLPNPDPRRREPVGFPVEDAPLLARPTAVHYDEPPFG